MTLIEKENLTKRVDKYKEGGVFAVTYRQLVQDLMGSKLSPSIIDGLLINQAHKSDLVEESFLIRLIRAKNPDIWIKCFTNSANFLC